MAKEGSGAKLCVLQPDQISAATSHILLSHLCLFSGMPYSFLLPATFRNYQPKQTHTYPISICSNSIHPSRDSRHGASFLKSFLITPSDPVCPFELLWYQAGFYRFEYGILPLLLQCGVAGHLSMSLYPYHLAQLMCSKV